MLRRERASLAEQPGEAVVAAQQRQIAERRREAFSLDEFCDWRQDTSVDERVETRDQSSSAVQQLEVCLDAEPIQTV